MLVAINSFKGRETLDGKDHLVAVTNRLEPSIMTGGYVQHRDKLLQSGCVLNKVAQYRNLSVHAVNTQTEVAYSLRTIFS